jgi:predicted NAD-dependent protein-ADP-ribosyltransferase YbiA (DUF1768 family)
MCAEMANQYWKTQPFRSGDHLTSLATEAYENWTKYESIGHYVQAAKAILFRDYIAFSKLMATKSTRLHQQIGYSIEGFSEEKWKRCKPIILRSALDSLSGIKHDSWKKIVFH